MNLPAPPDLPIIGTKASIDMKPGSYYAEQVMNLKKKVYKERKAREVEGKGDRLSEMQELNAPEINFNLVRFDIEILLKYLDDNGG